MDMMNDYNDMLGYYPDMDNMGMVSPQAGNPVAGAMMGPGTYPSMHNPMMHMEYMYMYYKYMCKYMDYMEKCKEHKKHCKE
jgi:hypothetical protein